MLHGHGHERQRPMFTPTNERPLLQKTGSDLFAPEVRVRTFRIIKQRIGRSLREQFLECGEYALGTAILHQVIMYQSHAGSGLQGREKKRLLHAGILAGRHSASHSLRQD